MQNQAHNPISRVWSIPPQNTRGERAHRTNAHTVAMFPSTHVDMYNSWVVRNRYRQTGINNTQRFTNQPTTAVPGHPSSASTFSASRGSILLSERREGLSERSNSYLSPGMPLLLVNIVKALTRLARKGCGRPPYFFFHEAELSTYSSVTP